MREESVLIIGSDKAWVNRWKKEEGVSIVGHVNFYDEPHLHEDLPSFSSVAEALHACRPDIVTLVTPPSRKTSIDVVREAALHGCDVLLQKLRPALQGDGERLLELAESAGRTIGIGEAYRFDREIAALQGIIEEGRIGDVGEVRWMCRRPVVEAPWMAAYAHVMLEDLTYHHLGALQRLIGLDWSDVYARSAAPAWSAFPHTSADLLVCFRNGVRLSYSASWTAGGALTSWLGEIVVDGTEGTAVSDERGVRVYRRHSEQAEEVALPDLGSARSDIVGEFLTSRRAGRRPATDIRDFIQVSRLIEAALTSSKETRVVRA